MRIPRANGATGRHRFLKPLCTSVLYQAVAPPSTA